ncbi:MAG: hypothetical protein KR126chlam5_01035 [Candidatus Anoxychlamydiales bacterium]|nr:hypothetical protein [Candidatus Anoxychlamydiales bacterium]
MQKIKFFTFLVLAVFPLISSAQELFVEVEDKGRSFKINMRTFQDQSSFGVFKLSKVDIEKSTFSHDGIIDLYVEVDTNRRSQESVGPYKGSFTLRRSSNIPDGRYSLYINDEDYGFLYILEDRIYFDPINCL